MTRLEEFYKITDAEDYFDFFDVEYNEQLVNVKRFHIMRKFGEMIEKTKEMAIESDEKLLDFFKFALITVYKNFESGYNPSAADIWRMYDNPVGCIKVTLDEMGEVADVSSSCSSCQTSTTCSNSFSSDTPDFLKSE